MPHCPECEASVDVDEEEVEEGEVVNCPECGLDLEVVNTNPIELNPLDDEDDDEEEEDDLDADDDLDIDEEEDEEEEEEEESE